MAGAGGVGGIGGGITTTGSGRGTAVGTGAVETSETVERGGAGAAGVRVFSREETRRKSSAE
jgi:hypothetical protein